MSLAPLSLASLGSSASMLLSEAEALASAAHDALIAELESWPKPGLVSHVDCGSHADMNAEMFRASASAIRPFYAALALAGASGAEMGKLRQIGLEAECAMLTATGGINTHRGAIFGLGLLCAAAGTARAQGDSKEHVCLGRMVTRRWGPSILSAPVPRNTHGAEAYRRFGAGGARAQAAAGFAAAYQVGLPALRLGRSLRGGDEEAARLQAFFALLASVDDTNLLHRGGIEGLLYAQAQAAAFLHAGGVAQEGWRARAAALHRAFVARGLSPGGCADLLAITVFLEWWESAF